MIRLKMPNWNKEITLMKKNGCGLHLTVRRILLCSRIMGLFPLSGLTHTTSSHLRFTLKTPYTLYYITSIIGQMILFAMSFYWLLSNGISLPNVSNSIFYSSSLVSSLILSGICRFWPQLTSEVEEIEKSLPPFKRNLARFCNIVMFFLLTSALAEYCTSKLYDLTVAKACDAQNLWPTYFRYNIPWIFEYTPYALWKGVLFEIFNFQSTFMWTYNDLLIVVISVYLAEHFVIHNQLLKKALKQNHFSCDGFREQYLKIVRLVKLFNGHIGIYILTSFGINLYWICMQLFFSLKMNYSGHVIACRFTNETKDDLLHGIEHSIYFTYSFSFLVTRTLLVLLFAARVHSNSIIPLFMLYEVPTSKYNVEVERFIDQIKSLKVALSGLDFFFVTRTMILSLLGAIITYELVLLQFNQ